ncbi:hypothetical protein FYJ53_16445 [Eubacterium sp. BL-380-WT-2B]|nr:hypothetical protein [Eubacterium callanderi]MSS95336.1 hypothetical protein [Eubacterium sp. BL-380-WT-2B]
MEAAEEVGSREMRCPICGFKVTDVPLTQTEVVYVRCRKCKFEGPLSPAYFRRMKRKNYAYTGPYQKRGMIR